MIFLSVCFCKARQDQANVGAPSETHKHDEPGSGHGILPTPAANQPPIGQDIDARWAEYPTREDPNFQFNPQRSLLKPEEIGGGNRKTFLPILIYPPDEGEEPGEIYQEGEGNYAHTGNWKLNEAQEKLFFRRVHRALKESGANSVGKWVYDLRDDHNDLSTWRSNPGIPLSEHNYDPVGLNKYLIEEGYDPWSYVPVYFVRGLGAFAGGNPKLSDDYEPFEGASAVMGDAAIESLAGISGEDGRNAYEIIKGYEYPDISASSLKFDSTYQAQMGAVLHEGFHAIGALPHRDGVDDYVNNFGGVHGEEFAKAIDQDMRDSQSTNRMAAMNIIMNDPSRYGWGSSSPTEAGFIIEKDHETGKSLLANFSQQDLRRLQEETLAGDTKSISPQYAAKFYGTQEKRAETLDTKPEEGDMAGVLPRGVPTVNTGQGRGNKTGMPKVSSAIPASVPGITDVQGEPDPNKLTEMFQAYSAGQLSREQLINQLDVFSTGRGGILEMLESMEHQPQQITGHAFGGETGQIQGGMLPPQVQSSESESGAIPPMEGPLDKRHQRIAGLIQNYGVMPEDANQMATVLNPNEQGVPYAWEQEQINLTFGDDPRTATGMGTGNVTKQGAFDAARASVSPSIKSLSDDQIWDVINTQAANAPMTAADINVDHTPRSQVPTSQGGTMSTGWESPETDDYEDIPNTTFNPNVQPNIVWDPVRNQYIDTNKMQLLPPPPATFQGGAMGDMSTAATNQAIQQGGGAYGDMAAAADTVRATPAINGGAYGDMGTAATNRAIEQGGGAYGDMATAADTVTQRNFPGAFGDAAWTAQNTPPAVPPAGPTISAEEYAKFKESGPVGANPLGGLEQIGADLFGKLFQKMGWENPGLLETKEAKFVENYLKDQLGFTAGVSGSSPQGAGTREDPFTQGTGTTGVGDIYYGSSGKLNEQGVPIPVARDAGGVPVPDPVEDKPTEPFFGTDPLASPTDATTDPATGAAYTGTTAAPTSGTTGFNTVDDFDFPEIKNFLNALSTEARSGMGGENLPGIIIDSMTAITNARNQGNVQLANANTNAAIAYLDRAAAVTRDNARRALDRDVAMGQVNNELTLAAKTEQFRQVMERFRASGEVPAIDANGQFIMETVDGKEVIKTKDSFEREMSYAELTQQKDLQMTEMFGKLIQTEGAKQVGIDSFETLASQSFGFTKILQQSEQMGYLADAEGKPILDDAGNRIDTLAARRYGWTKDIEEERNKLLSRQNNNDMEKAELQAATVQYGQELSSLIDAGKLAEAVAVRKEKSLNDRRLAEATKRELTVNTLLSLSKPSTMLFVKRYGLLDDLGAALGIDFGQEAMGQVEPPAMITAGQYPTYDQLWNASPEERQIMLAETAAYENVSVEGALQRIQDWRPGGTPLRRTAIKGATR